jgi:hypothetical protein
MIYTTYMGEQWIGDGAAMYSLRGMPHMTPETVLRIFDVPPDKQNKWKQYEDDVPAHIDCSDYASGEKDIEPLRISVVWNGCGYMVFPDGNRLYTVNKDYIKPLLDEPDYLTYHKRETAGGGFLLACKIGLELKAVIAPAILQKREGYTAEIYKIAGLYRQMEHQLIADSAQEMYGAHGAGGAPKVDPDTGEILDGQINLEYEESGGETT